MYEQWFDGRWALDNSDLTPIEVDEWQAVQVGSTVGMDFAGMESYRSLIFVLIWDFGLQDITTCFTKKWKGVRRNRKIEPCTHFHVSFRWKRHLFTAPYMDNTSNDDRRIQRVDGEAVHHVVDIAMAGPIEPLPAPTLFFVHASPGGEITVNDNLVFFARVRFSFLVGGNRVESMQFLGEGFLSSASEPVGKWAPGFEERRAFNSESVR